MADSLLILDDLRLKQLLENPAARNAFPFLATAHARLGQSPAQASKTCCRGKKTRSSTSKSPDLASVRRAIANQSPNKLLILKQLLGSPRQVLVNYRNGRGGAVRFKF